MKKVELEATCRALVEENRRLKEQIVMLKRSTEAGDDR